ncbi:hypothetical protein IV77_GL001507 [Olsenella uli DSM 7084]|nr:hypothetical protein IV77_GL001507 [Olsenella uli DSM 7084]
MALCYSITRGNSVEFDWFTTHLENVLLNFLGQLAQGFVTGADFVPAVRNRDERLISILKRID